VDRLFLDANILFSAAYKPGAGILTLWQLPDVELLSTDYAVREAENALANTRPARLSDFVALIQQVTIVADAPAGSVLPAGVQLPAKDEPILLAAIAAQATHLLTGDI